MSEFMLVPEQDETEAINNEEEVIVEAETAVVPVNAGGTMGKITPLPPLPVPIPVPVVPILPLNVSGTYKSITPFPGPVPQPWLTLDELHLDVDGRFPQMAASGTRWAGITTRVDWVAKLTSIGANAWKGAIFYKNGGAATFPYTNVDISVTGITPSTRQARVVFKSATASVTRLLRFESPYFHPVDFEFDYQEGEVATTSINTGDHPNRPASLPIENLSIETVYRRAGFNVTTSTGSGSVPVSGTGADGKWSDAEMHDAMQVYWSKFANRPQWAIWVFFASLHEMGTRLGGIMFDDIGPNHRQGTAIFNDAFISIPPAGEPNPVAWVRRMIFWTAAHEMGHTFNLAHSWDKALGTPWIPLVNEPEARSFMNYPYNVAGGQSAFFANFFFRFSDQELLFLRHAPERFLMPGNANWFDHHGFQQEMLSPEPKFKLELRVNREKPMYEFMEPVTLELKLTNVSGQPQIVTEDILADSHEMIVILKKDGKPARQWLPYAQRCGIANGKVINAGESMYESLYVSSGLNGWDIAEPGWYTVQLALGPEGDQVLSNQLRVRVAPPRGYDEEYLAQDFFSEDVGRIVALDGSRVLDDGNAVLHEVANRLSDQRVGCHANLALGLALARDYKELTTKGNDSADLVIKVRPAQMSEAKKLLDAALVENGTEMAESLGHVDYKWYMDKYSMLLAKQGEESKAADAQEALLNTLEAREVKGRKVLQSVLEEVKAQRDAYESKGKTNSSKNKTKTKNNKKTK